jgi:hypothetical protein
MTYVCNLHIYEISGECCYMIRFSTLSFITSIIYIDALLFYITIKCFVGPNNTFHVEQIMNSKQ